MGRPVVHCESMSKDPAKVSGLYTKISERRMMGICKTARK